MKRTLALVALLLLSCGSPKQAPQVAPAVERVAAPVAASQAHASEIRGMLSKAQDELSQRRIDALAFKSQIDEFRSQGMTTEQELARVWEELTKETERNMFLETTLTETQVVVNELEKSLATAREAIEGAMEIALQKDEEVKALYTDADNLNRRLDRAEQKLASANVYKRGVLFVALGLATLWVLRELLPLVMKAVRPI